MNQTTTTVNLNLTPYLTLKMTTAKDVEMSVTINTALTWMIIVHKHILYFPYVQSLYNLGIHDEWRSESGRIKDPQLICSNVFLSVSYWCFTLCPGIFSHVHDR